MSVYKQTAIQCLRDEADALLALIPNIDDDFDKAVELILSARGKLVVTGVGKSGHIGAKIAATLSSTGTPSFFINPLDAFHGDLGVIAQGDIVMAISNSGQTDELLRFFPYLIAKKIPIIGMSGNASSLLAQYSTVHLNISVGHEACPMGLAPTSSTTATLALGDALACALIVARDFKAGDFAQFHPGGALGRRLLTRACDVMQSENLPTIAPTAQMGEALVAMTSGRLGMCIAIEDRRIVGVITDGDIRRGMERFGDSFFVRTVAEMMSRKPISVRPETKVSEIENLLQQHKIHSVLVINDDEELVGVVDSFRTMI
ncbi:KpsF/GutQ family sugar-phosphate isomerase [Alloprevotella sp. OH1205_COT-284]|uniref:KpsF/GutQ family sugar-phosphate isomerase n=1 Tax=Alloprevotella sp. OH1205_COT-284 TaxID=2491043 RepID=UPI000F6025F6|nr:KpsF/GutQ family sugar-phosphate isomerase [Alloprevotella sp. OH1205_COT-284]RRD80482.1 KpsF/GutQ family sugar-phosphate isomerase [Alloprevotella sp. OH1205_COT-284]